MTRLPSLPSSPRLKEERILLSSLKPEDNVVFSNTTNSDEVKIKYTFADDNLSSSKMIKSPKLYFFKPTTSQETTIREEEEVKVTTTIDNSLEKVDEYYEEDESVVRIVPKVASIRIASPTALKRVVVVSNETSTFSEPTNSETLVNDPTTTTSLPQVFRRKASAREQGKWKHEGADGDDQQKGKAVPEGSGGGTIIAYARRSAEDRSGRPLHSQFETIIGYVNECILSKMSPRTKQKGIRKFFVDNGISGTVEPEKRPGFCALMEEVKALSNDGIARNSSIHVIAYDATRIARSLAVGAQIKKFLERAGATLHLAQSRMIVEGANAELFFGLNLQIASSERTLTITRVKNAFAHHPDWDPRKSFGWRFISPGIPPEKIPEEQAILEKMRKMFEEEGLQVKEIAKIIQDETGGRRLRRPPTTTSSTTTASESTEEEKKELWTGTEITFLAKKHKWKWGGGLSLKDLEKETEIAKREGKDLEAFLKEKKGTRYDGVKINRAMLKKFFIEAQPKWKAIAIERIRVWIRQEKHSVDDIANMLKDEVERPGKEGWPRQTVWRLIKHCEELEKRSKMTF